MDRNIQRIIGSSPTLSDTLDHASELAPLNRPVLVIGERGSGKELIAERLHYLSTRWEQALHKVNCAAISEQLLDSELFGYEPGAFTGATKTFKGRFERADGGTLLLDELGTMPMRIQEKVLRIIEYGEFERLGGQETLQVDTRIVGATNANLLKLAEENKFREDLLDRLAFDVIHIPPLRQRVEDIPELVEHFAIRMTHELGWEYYSGFTKRALDELQNHLWPGNIRELKNVVERSLYRWGNSDKPIDNIILNPFSSQNNVAPSTKVEQVKTQTATEDSPPQTVQKSSSNTKPPSFTQQIKQLELSLIQHALNECHYHQKSSAEYLQLTYHQFRALLRKYKSELNMAKQG